MHYVHNSNFYILYLQLLDTLLMFCLDFIQSSMGRTLLSTECDLNYFKSFKSSVNMLTAIINNCYLHHTLSTTVLTLAPKKE